ncbi:MAG: hypothetical protein LQ339_005571 [Xanthoria mediterranea]|nr:MAG: hypothetical protein LQ339_005571 [Xanthoria mediterranea]
MQPTAKLLNKPGLFSNVKSRSCVMSPATASSLLPIPLKPPLAISGESYPLATTCEPDTPSSEPILNIKTSDAVKSAAEHVRDILRLCRSDNMGVRDILPSIYLRLGRDQDAYDFIKSSETTGFSSDYDFGDLNLPYLNIVDADVFESPHYLYGEFPTLAALVCVTLLKIRLLLDLVALMNAGCLARRLPQELLDRIKTFIPAVRTRPDQPLQVDELYVAVAKATKHFWPALLDPGAHLTARPEITSRGTQDEMQVKLQYCYDSWIETPGSIDFIKTMSAR